MGKPRSLDVERPTALYVLRRVYGVQVDARRSNAQLAAILERENVARGQCPQHAVTVVSARPVR